MRNIAPFQFLKFKRPCREFEGPEWFLVEAPQRMDLRDATEKFMRIGHAARKTC